MELSLPGTFAPRSELAVELSLPGTFVLKSIRSQELPMIALLVHKIGVQELLRLHCMLCPVLYSDNYVVDALTTHIHTTITIINSQSIFYISFTYVCMYVCKLCMYVNCDSFNCFTFILINVIYDDDDD